jgi:hypothetical protein
MDWSSFASVGTFDFDKLLAIVPGTTSICHGNRKLESKQNRPVRNRANNIRNQQQLIATKFTIMPLAIEPPSIPVKQRGPIRNPTAKGDNTA